MSTDVVVKERNHQPEHEIVGCRVMGHAYQLPEHHRDT
eukprot:COSAG02_NODE_1181_length_14030_cov_6.652143_1_plen_37_part_10